MTKGKVYSLCYENLEILVFNLNKWKNSKWKIKQGI